MLKDLKEELEQLVKLGRFKSLAQAKRLNESTLKIRGKTVVDFTSWDFLALATNKRIKRDVQQQVEKTGLGSASPRLAAGTSAIHLACEERLAKFSFNERALLFSSRNQAVLTIITSLVSEQDIIFTDEQITSPVVDAAYLVNAPVKTLSLATDQKLEKELEQAQHYKRRFIFTESVSPVTGVVQPLERLNRLAKRYNCLLIVDESFGLGILGARGAGGCEVAKLGKDYLCQFADLSTALNAYGAYISGAAILIDYILNRSRTFEQELAPPPAMIAGLESAIDIIELAPLERELLFTKAKKVREGLKAIAFKGVIESNTPIISLSLRNLKQAYELQNALFQKGFLASIMQQGALLNEGAILRLIITKSHQEQDLEALLEAFSEIFSQTEDL